MKEEIFLEPCKKAYNIHQQSRYGDLWEKMSYYELVSAAAYKARRATLLSPWEAKIEDDILDAINFLIFSWVQLKGRKDYGKESQRLVNSND